MPPRPSSPPQAASFSAWPPALRIAALADPGTAVASLDAPRPSVHLARFGIDAQDDDGVATAEILLHGAPVLVAAQDDRFLRGSVGANHADALASLFRRARSTRAPVLLLAASGGVRLHEANAAELALARALRAAVDLRLAGVPFAAIAVGDVFGGASVLTCAATRLAMLPAARIGLSGPKVIETLRGRAQFDAGDPARVGALFGAGARVPAGDAEAVGDDASALRGWLFGALFSAPSFDTQLALAQARAPHAFERPAAAAPPRVPALLAAAGDMAPVDADGWLWRSGDAVFTRPFTGAPFDGVSVHALDAALLALARTPPRTLVVVEDSLGHDVSAEAERRFDSRRLAHHAAVLGALRAQGVPVVAWLAGLGQGAAFFANALQAPRLVASTGARVVAMDPAAIARVTGHDVARLVEDDPMLGQPVRHFAAQGGVDALADGPAALRAALGV